MKKLFSLIFIAIEILALAFSARIIFPICDFYIANSSDKIGSVFLLPYALFALIIGLTISITLQIKSKIKKNYFVLFLQRVITLLYLIVIGIFIFCVVL